MEQTEVIIIGGGLAGLTAAALLAKAGKSIVLLEKTATFGGRACTQNHTNFLLNLGPHALFKHGIAAQTYQELGLVYAGGEPAIAQGLFYTQGALHPIPFAPMAILRSRIFNWAEKWEILGQLKRITTLNPAALRGTSLADWLGQHVRSARVRIFLQTVFRLATYCTDFERLDAGLAFAQLQLSLGGVLYVDGGWQTLVNGLVKIAQQFGAKLLTEQTIRQIEWDNAVKVVNLNNGRQFTAPDLILATPPETVSQLTGQTFSTHPIRAACLDVALRQLPRPDRPFVLGLEEPLYYSVHSAYGQLAPTSGAVLHVARYLSQDDTIPAATLRTQLETFLDNLQPGWRSQVVHTRFMPNLAVVQDIPGHSPQIKSLHVYLAGDWVGEVGMLSDRAVASAVEATQRILKQP
jgi:phytoene dehydrogenase-like protein